MNTPTPEEQAAALVLVASLTPDGPLFVQLKGEKETVSFGPYENPDIARGDGAKATRILAEVIRKAAGGTT